MFLNVWSFDSCHITSRNENIYFIQKVLFINLFPYIKLPFKERKIVNSADHILLPKKSAYNSLLT